MSRWARGEATIEQQLAGRELQSVRGAQANGEPLLEKARHALQSARILADSDLDSAFTLAYDAMRFACVGLLAHQGLRATSKGGHLAVQAAVGAQFGGVFSEYGALRKRRNEVEYPDYPDDRVDADEVGGAFVAVEAIIDAAGKLLPNLGLF